MKMIRSWDARKARSRLSMLISTKWRLLVASESTVRDSDGISDVGVRQ